MRLILNVHFATVLINRFGLKIDWSFVILDAFPISLGHSLIIPKRHIASFFEANEQEHLAFLQALQEAQQKLQQTHAPDGFNIGINDGLVAGQTVRHLHIHLIPRYQGDCVDPRGGVRWILPEKGYLLALSLETKVC
jgi:diadenosine tetraphosphate (Ap4A) HIT family hydrolase